MNEEKEKQTDLENFVDMLHSNNCQLIDIEHNIRFMQLRLMGIKKVEYKMEIIDDCDSILQRFIKELSNYKIILDEIDSDIKSLKRAI